MLNRDLNSRFEDWLLNPRETLDFEVKQWLDMSDVESHGIVAKALIALENHGGGFLLFGYQDVNGTLTPDRNRPPSLEPYGTDAINAIVKRRAEPPFHVEVTFQRHPTTGEEFPLVAVAGTSRVPVRSDSATPGNSLRQHVYYIRAPGPESRGPLNGAEWDALIKRSVQNQREEIIDLLRGFLWAGASAQAPAVLPREKEHLAAFKRLAIERWTALNAALPQGHPAKIVNGFVALSARIIDGASKSLSAREILAANQQARRYTGWPPFVELPQDESRPRLVGGCIEAWLGQEKNADLRYADFWRIDPMGNFILVRAYEEDAGDSQATKPGTALELSIPVWRVGEFLLRVADLGEAMYDGNFEIIVDCEWQGLAGRRLVVRTGRRWLGGRYIASENAVCTDGQFTRQSVRDLLPEAVKALTAPLYEHFDFFQPPPSLYKGELDVMLKHGR